jgi:hypothetical protein
MLAAPDDVAVVGVATGTLPSQAVYVSDAALR